MSKTQRCATVLAVIVALSPSAWALAPGQAAPELAIGEYVNGGPVSVAAAKGKQVLVVEFWATWCAPCRASIPHLSRLQRLYKDKGLVAVGVTDEAVGHVKKWLKATGLNMDYTVASDTSRKTHDAYGGVESVPQAFVVNRQGTVVWSGHPMDDTMGLAVTRALAGKADPKLFQQLGEVMNQFQAAAQANELDKLLPICQRMIELAPDNARGYDLKIRVLQALGRHKEAAAARGAMVEALADDALGLDKAARELLTAPDLTQRDLKRGLASARRVVKLTGGKDFESLATLARGYAELGLWAKAIATQQKALGLAHDADKQKLAQELAYYRQAKALAAADDKP